MRCALKFDEDKALIEQDVAAWGEMQSLSEEPAYKETDIKDEMDMAYFKGFKYAMDRVCNDLECCVEDYGLKIKWSEFIQEIMACDIAMQLFTIIDSQED